jgi:hypothetical protein
MDYCSGDGAPPVETLFDVDDWRNRPSKPVEKWNKGSIPVDVLSVTIIALRLSGREHYCMFLLGPTRPVDFGSPFGSFERTSLRSDTLAQQS